MTERSTGPDPTRKQPGRLARRGLVVLLLSLWVPACAPLGSGSGTPSPEEETEEPPIVARIDNQSRFSLDLFVLTQGHEYRLGSMQGFDTATFVVPEMALATSSSIRLAADAVGRRLNYVSEDILISPGVVVNWDILNEQGLSHLYLGGRVVTGDTAAEGDSTERR